MIDQTKQRQSGTYACVTTGHLWDEKLYACVQCGSLYLWVYPGFDPKLYEREHPKMAALIRRVIRDNMPALRRLAEFDSRNKRSENP